MKNKLKNKDIFKEFDPADPPFEIPEKLDDVEYINDSNRVSYIEYRKLFSKHHMTEGELKELFVIIDHDKNNFIDQIEWADFRKVFIIPFT